MSTGSCSPQCRPQPPNSGASPPNQCPPPSSGCPCNNGGRQLNPGNGCVSSGGNSSGSSNGGGNGGGGLAAGNARVAVLEGGAGGLCFTPDAKQIAKLVNRHAYVNATFATWAGARSIKVISIRLCPDAAAVIASQRNINRLQSFVSTQASLAGRLQGHSAAQVIGVDRTADTLVVYVM